MLISVTGGTGFVGKAVVTELLQRGHKVNVLARHLPPVAAPYGLTYYTGSVVTGAGLEPFLQGADAVVHLVGIIREAGPNTFEAVHHQGTVNVLEAAKSAHIRRFLHMSALGTRKRAVSSYHRTKWSAEEAVRQSGLDWSIFRPSIIFGPGDAFINMLAGTIRKASIMPVIGGGGNLMQPVHVNDVARSFASALERPGSIGKLYELGGPEIFSFKQILNLTAQAIGKKPFFITAPAWAVKFPLAVLQTIGVPLPISTDQLIMLQEDNIRQGGDDVDELGIQWTPFEEGIKKYLE